MFQGLQVDEQDFHCLTEPAVCDHVMCMECMAMLCALDEQSLS